MPNGTGRLESPARGIHAGEGIVFEQVDDEKMRGISYGKLPLDPAVAYMVVCGPFDDPAWEVANVAHEVGHILYFWEMGRDEARAFFCTGVDATHLGVRRISWQGQRVMLYGEALASLKGLDVLKQIGTTHRSLATMKDMMIRLFATYCRTCTRDVVNEVLNDPQVRSLVN